MPAPTYPPGVTTRQGDMSGAIGLGGTVTFQAVSPLLKLSTGDVIYNPEWTADFDKVTGRIPPQLFLTTDQADLGISAGNPIVDWTYKATVVVEGVPKFHFYFLVPTAGSVMDIDQQQHFDSPGGIVSTPAGVVSVAGLTGAVSASALNTALGNSLGLPSPTPDGKLLGVQGGVYALVDPPSGINGQDGESAYEIAVDHGFSGDVTAWLNSLKGAPGNQGNPGNPGGPGGPGPAGAPFLRLFRDETLGIWPTRPDAGQNVEWATTSTDIPPDLIAGDGYIRLSTSGAITI